MQRTYQRSSTAARIPASPRACRCSHERLKSRRPRDSCDDSQPRQQEKPRAAVWGLERTPQSSQQTRGFSIKLAVEITLRFQEAPLRFAAQLDNKDAFY